MNLKARYEETPKNKFLLIRGKFDMNFLRASLSEPSPYIFEAIDSDSKHIITEGYVGYSINSKEEAQALAKTIGARLSKNGHSLELIN